MGRSNTTNRTKKEDYGFEFLNHFQVKGVIQKVVSTSDELNVYKVDVPTLTDKKKVSHAFLLIKEFTKEAPFDSGSKVFIEGNIITSSYEAKDGTTKYTQDLIATDISDIDPEDEDEIPFN